MTIKYEFKLDNTLRTDSFELFTIDEICAGCTDDEWLELSEEIKIEILDDFLNELYQEYNECGYNASYKQINK